MTVYVDDMQAKFGRMVMCHMLADTREELEAMADKIGVARRWIQYPGTYKEHFDVAMGARAKAVKAGAVQITQQQAAKMTRRRAITGELGPVATVDAWYEENVTAKRRVIPMPPTPEPLV